MKKYFIQTIITVILGTLIIGNCTPEIAETPEIPEIIDAENGFAVVFQSNEGSLIPSQVIADDDTVVRIPNPTREGYVFGGWYTDNKSFNDLYNFSSPVDTNLTLYAQWVEVVTVSFNTNGGSSIQTQTIVSGTMVSKPITPTRENSAFNGWFTDEELNNKFSFTTSVNSDLRLYASWVEGVTITFNSNGGTAVPSQTIILGNTAERPLAVPTREGFAFLGWFRDNNTFSDEYTFTDPLNSDLRLYANWIEGVTIAFNSNGGSEVLSQTIETGSILKKPLTPTRESFAFDGWYLDNTTFNNAYDFNGSVNADLTLYAKWVAGVSVTFVSNGGTAVSSQTIATGSILKKPLTPTRTNFAFLGWFIDNTTFNDEYTFTDPINSDLTLYANWTEGVTVTFNTNGGSAILSQTIATGTTIKSPLNPNRSGFSFVGWFTDDGIFNNAFNFSGVVNSDLTLYANWVAGVTVIFNTNNGSAVPSQSIVSGTMADRPIDPTRANFAFDGWFTDNNTFANEYNFSDAVNTDITLYAKWVEGVTIAFNSNNGSDVSPQTILTGTTADKPIDPTRANFAFDGWFTDNNTFANEYNFSDAVNADITLYAKWVEGVTIAFNSNNGSDVSPQTILTGTTADKPIDPTRTNFAFDGWFTDNNTFGNEYNFSDAVNADITLYAKWVTGVTISFNSNNGSSVLPQTILAGATAQNPVNPTRAGHRFIGWFTDNNTFRSEYSFTSAVNTDITLYANWVQIVTISFNVNGGSTVSSQSIESGTMAEKPIDPTRAGHRFVGWFMDNNTFANEYNFNSAVNADLTLHANWIAGVIVSFNSNNGSAVPSQNIESGTMAEKPIDPTRADFMFDGWFTDNNTFANEYNFNSAVNADLTLYAKWVAGVIVSFNSNNGSAVPSQNIESGTMAEKPIDPTRVNFAFDGWFTDNNTFRNEYNFSDAVNADITLYAKWVTGITVSFNSNSGSAVSPQTIISGTTAEKPIDPTRANFAFDGWFTDNNTFANEYNFSNAVNADITLYAKWVTGVTVSFNSNSGSTVSSQTILSGTTAEKPIDPTRADFMFDGWFTDNNIFANEYNFNGAVNADITLYANWVTGVTISFNSNGGSAVLPKTIETGATIQNPVNPTRAGYKFIGWFKDNTTFMNEFVFTTAVNADITLYANWVQIVTVSFNSNNGSVVSSQSIESGTMAEKPIDPTRANFMFDGWFTDNNIFANKYNFNSVANTDITLYAKWVEGVSISFNSNGGSAVLPKTIETGATIQNPVNPTRAGYKFIGWFKDNTTFMDEFMFTTAVNADITLYANWIQIFTISFNSNSGSAIAPQSVETGTLAERPLNPTRAGHRFVGWFTDNNTFANEYSFTSAVTTDITLYANWVVGITINFNSNGGSSIQSQSVATGSMATRPIDPTRPNFAFDGWFTDNTTFNNEYDFNSAVTGSVNLFARWVAGVTVTFNTNNGSTLQAQTVATGSMAERPIDPTRPNFAFDGWFTDNTTFNNAYDFSTAVNADITLYARWVAGVTVTFNTNEGSTIQTQAISTGSMATRPIDPTRTNFSFDGWFTDNTTFNNAYNFNTAVNADITLYARWVAGVTVTFVSNSGTAVTPQTIATGSMAQRPANPTRDGFSFEGWFTDDGVFDNAYDFNTAVNADLTVYAGWIQTYTITLDLDGGSFADPSTQIVEENGLASQPTTPTRDGFRFLRWSTDDNSGTPFSFTTTPIISDITIRARWGASYTVTFNPNGGEPIDEQIILQGQRASAPINPENLSALDFVGWFTDEDLTVSYDFTTPITADITLNAKWDNYVFSYSVSGDEATLLRLDINRLALKGNLLAIPGNINGKRVRVMPRRFFPFGNATVPVGLVLGEGIEVIEEEALQLTNAKGDLVIPNSVTRIERAAFAGSGFDGTLTLSNNLEYIGSNAFALCDGFVGSLVLPNTLTHLGDTAFRRCTGFQGSLILPNSLRVIRNSTFDRCSGFRGRLVLPNQLDTIEDYAFINFGHATGDLVIPATVKHIGTWAFSATNDISRYIFEGSTPPTFGTQIFFFRNTNPTILVPPGAVGAYRNATNFTIYSGNISAGP